MKRYFLIIAGLLFSISLFSQTKWYNPFDTDFLCVQGRAWQDENKGNYHRLPPRAEENVRDAVWNLSKQSAGLSLSFTTNSNAIIVRYTVKNYLSMPHMPSTGVSGVDLYINDDSKQQLWCEGKYNFGDTITYRYNNITYKSKSGGDNNFQLFLPLYNEVDWLEVGVNDGSFFTFNRIPSQKPVVIYGTSIAQGACASRPGMAWTNIVQRLSHVPVINLGFSGNGRLEPELFELLTEIDAALFIIDCMPNMTGNAEDIVKNTLNGVEALRSKSDVPILLVEHCGYNGAAVSDKRRREYEKTNRELESAYQSLRKGGVKNIHYLSYKEISLSPDSQVDGVHATDLGMQQYADAYVKKINSILK